MIKLGIVDILSTDECGHVAKFSCPQCGLVGFISFSNRHWYAQMRTVVCRNKDCETELEVPIVACNHTRRNNFWPEGDM